MNAEYQPRRRIFLVMFFTLAALLLAAIVIGMTAPALLAGPDATAMIEAAIVEA